MSERKEVSIKWLGHSSFEFVSPQGTVVLIDPFLSGNPLVSDELRQVKEVDIVALTHGHGDHVGDTLEIYERLRPKVVGMFELMLCLQESGVSADDVIGMNIGGEIVHKNVQFAMLPAVHSSTFMKGEQMIPAGLACGYVMTFENGKRIYHAGDTWLFSEMDFIRRIYKPDVAILPIGGFYTMNIKAARIAAELLSPQIVIPMHYDTFPAISVVPKELEDELTGMGVELMIPEIGEPVFV